MNSTRHLENLKALNYDNKNPIEIIHVTPLISYTEYFNQSFILESTVEEALKKFFKNHLFIGANRIEIIKKWRYLKTGKPLELRNQNITIITFRVMCPARL